MDLEKKWRLEEQLHRTWVELLLAQNYREIAAIALDGDVELVVDLIWDGNNEYEGFVGIVIGIPANMFAFVTSNEQVQKIAQNTVTDVAEGYVNVPRENMQYSVRVKLVEPEEDWQNIVRRMIANMSDPNQGRITELARDRNGQKLFVYNEMKFASKSEIRIAQEFEARSILFFPLAMAVRAETGNFYKDHREADFLVCEEGTWGILEVSYHPDRYERDSEKNAWWKKSGILCVEHYSAERCFNEPKAVVDEFLEILAKHR